MSTAVMEALEALPAGQNITVREDAGVVTWTKAEDGEFYRGGLRLRANMFKGAVDAGRVFIEGVEETAAAAPTYRERMRLDTPLMAGEMLVYTHRSDTNRYLLLEQRTSDNHWLCALSTGDDLTPGYLHYDPFTTTMSDNPEPARSDRWSRLSVEEVREKFPWTQWMPLLRSQWQRDFSGEAARLVRHANRHRDRDLMDLLTAQNIGVSVHETPYTLTIRTQITRANLPYENYGIDSDAVTQFYDTEVMWTMEVRVPKATLNNVCSCHDVTTADLNPYLPEGSVLYNSRRGPCPNIS